MQHESRRRILAWRQSSRGAVRKGTAITSVLVLCAALAALGAAVAEDGNITPNAIEVQDDANLYPVPASGCTSNNAFNNTPVTGFDWVKDCLSHAGDTAWPAASEAAARGHLNGFRVLDGVDKTGEADIFLTGGKEQDVSTWNPGPGSIGSAKYDATQTYIANNTTEVFFGMERRGNNGTTAFDWEFNRFAPNNPQFPNYIPNRSECDVMVTFEMQGSGGSGSATPHLFRYNDPDVTTSGGGGSPAPSCTGFTPASTPVLDTNRNGLYVELPAAQLASIIATINSAATPSAPWGTVSKDGTWSTGSIDRFQFAEAKVPLSLLGISPGDTCTSISRFLQVRTRSAATDTSDLKDLTKISKFDFFAPDNPTQTLATNCLSQFTFGTDLTPGPATWSFSIPDTNNQATPITLAGVNPTVVSAGVHASGKTTWTATGNSGTVQVAGFPQGVNSVAIDVSHTGQSGGCTVGDSGQITVFRGQSGQAQASSDCDGLITYSASVTGGKAPYDITVELQQSDGQGGWTTRKTDTYNDDTDGSVGNALTPFDGGAFPGTWRVHVTSTDSQTVGPNGAGCTVTFDSGDFQVRDTLTASAVKDAATTVGSSLTAGLDGGHAGALDGDTVGYQWQYNDNGTWKSLTGKTTEDTTYAGIKTDGSSAAVNFSIASGTAAGSYKGTVWTVQVRLQVTRTVAGQICTATSPPVTLKVVEGVDP